MRRYLFATVAGAVAAVVVGTTPAFALVAVPSPPGQLAATSQVVVVGKVTAVEKELAEVLAPYVGAKDKQKYKVAVVKVESALAGIDGAKVKEVKVGIFQPPKPDPNAKLPGGIRPPRGPAVAVELKEGQDVLLFLNKHPNGDFYLMAGFGPPINPTVPEGKKALEEAKKVTAVLADPMKALKSDRAEARAEAAAVLVMKYRAFPPFGGETEQVAIGAEESKLILKGLGEGEWKADRFGAPPGAFTAFNYLGLTEKDGWVPPKFVAAPGQPPPDFAVVTQAAFTTWLAGPGKDYQIKKVVPKKAGK